MIKFFLCFVLITVTSALLEIKPFGGNNPGNPDYCSACLEIFDETKNMLGLQPLTQITFQKYSQALKLTCEISNERGPQNYDYDGVCEIALKRYFGYIWKHITVVQKKIDPASICQTFYKCNKSDPCKE